MKILRIKMLLIFAAISLIAAVCMRLFNAFFFERNPAVFFVGIAVYGIAFALALAAACVLLLLSSLSLGPAIARISSGAGLEDAQKEKTRTALRRTENLIFWLNAVLFLACPLVERGWDVIALKVRLDWLEASLYILLNVTIGFMAALMERSLCDWLFQELRDRLGFTRVGDRRGEIQIKQRLLVTGFAAMFLSATLSSLAAIGFYREISAWISTASSQGVFSGQGTDAVSAASGEGGAADSSEGAAAQPKTDATTGATALSQQAFTSNTLKVVWQMGLVVVIVIVWGMCLMLSCARLVVRQLSELTRRMTEIGSGSADLTGRASVSRFDEIGDLTQAFNSTMDNLLALVCRVRAASDRVSQSTSELLGYAEESKQSVGSMDGSAARMEGIIASQDGVIHEASTAIGQLTASIDSVSGSLETQARFVDSSSAAVNRISESIKQIASLAEEEDRVSSTLSGNSAKGAGAMSDMIASMSGIEGSAASVSSAVQAISRIAAQTNLLAMNAAIEAAHAGDSGRGFAIVADEVRNLAESSARSTKEIVAHIRDMEGKIKRGAELASQAGKAFEDISRDIAVNSEFAKSISAAMREENAGIQEVLSSVEALIRATKEIERMTVEQHGCSGRMSKTIDDIVENAKTISRALGEQRAASESLGGLVARVCQKTEESSGVVAKLMEAVGGFRTGEGGETPLRA